MIQSTSAFQIQCLVIGFIKYFALRDDFAQERVPFFQPPFQVLGRANNNVEGKRGLNRPVDFHSFIELIAGRHHHEDVHIAIVMWRAVGIGAKEDDLVRFKSLGHFAGEIAYDAPGNVRAAVPAG